MMTGITKAVENGYKIAKSIMIINKVKYKIKRKQYTFSKQ